MLFFQRDALIMTALTGISGNFHTTYFEIYLDIRNRQIKRAGRHNRSICEQRTQILYKLLPHSGHLTPPGHTSEGLM